jgi:hypothetical protein
MNDKADMGDMVKIKNFEPFEKTSVILKVTLTLIDVFLKDVVENLIELVCGLFKKYIIFYLYMILYVC